MACLDNLLRGGFLSLVRIGLRVARHALRRSLLVLDEELAVVVVWVVLGVGYRCLRH